ncbi:MAG: archaemetzincin family Zn-dependent metalloprotease [Planctomycetota bacterium]|jgi:archaemetzincin
MGALHLVPFLCGTGKHLLWPLADRLAKAFGLPVEQHPPGFDPQVAFDASRGQYNSRILLGQLIRNTPPQATKVLGVTSVDLFIPVLTYVFGEAQLGSRAAVVSTHRLHSELYGLPPNATLLFERLCKEAIHELGHTYNLVHCHNDGCVMMSSTYVENIDLKSDRFCAVCRRAIAEHGAGPGDHLRPRVGVAGSSDRGRPDDTADRDVAPG